MKVKFYTLFYIGDSEKVRISPLREISNEERIFRYLKNCHILNHSLELNGLGKLTVLTNKKKFIELIQTKHRLLFDVEEISFSLNVPKGIGFYSAHFKIDAYKYLGTIQDNYSFLLDNDMICMGKMPDTVKELINKEVAIYYSFPIYHVEQHNVQIMKEINPKIIMGAWVGGEFIGGSADFFQSLYEVIMTFADRYFERIDKVFHQGDEMLTSIAIEEMRLSNKFILIDGGSVGTIYRYYSFYEKRPIDYYKSWFYHLLCDKSFLATIRASQINSNEDFCRLYRRYWGSILMRMKRLYKRIKSLIP